MEEDLAQYFYDKLIQPKANPGLVLAQFYSTFYKKELDERLIGRLGKLVRLYGRNLVFLSLLDVFDVEDINHTSIAGFVTYFIKERLENKFMHQENVDLTSSVEQTMKELKKILKNPVEEIENPFDA